jgi:hypothetical protein
MQTLLSAALVDTLEESPDHLAGDDDLLEMEEAARVAEATAPDIPFDPSTVSPGSSGVHTLTL